LKDIFLPVKDDRLIGDQKIKKRLTKKKGNVFLGTIEIINDRECPFLKCWDIYKHRNQRFGADFLVRLKWLVKLEWGLSSGSCIFFSRGLPWSYFLTLAIRNIWSLGDSMLKISFNVKFQLVLRKKLIFHHYERMSRLNNIIQFCKKIKYIKWNFLGQLRKGDFCTLEPIKREKSSKDSIFKKLIFWETNRNWFHQSKSLFFI